MAYRVGCQQKLKTRISELNQQDFKITTSFVANGANFNVTAVVKPAQIGDLKGLISGTNVNLYDGVANNILIAGSSTTGAPNQLTLVFTSMPQTVANSNNEWELSFPTLVVKGKDDVNYTLTNFKLKLPSPF